jgi:hypothetical protein
VRAGSCAAAMKTTTRSRSCRGLKLSKHGGSRWHGSWQIGKSLVKCFAVSQGRRGSTSASSPTSTGGPQAIRFHLFSVPSVSVQCRLSKEKGGKIHFTLVLLPNCHVLIFVVPRHFNLHLLQSCTESLACTESTLDGSRVTTISKSKQSEF